MRNISLTTPILNAVPAWDVADGYTFTFNVIGGDQVVKNILYINDNVSGDTVYTNTAESFLWSNTVPANASGLQNGTYYNAYVVTYNSLGESSSRSNTIQFYCYTTPTFEFLNISEGQVIQNISVSPILRYDQDEGEALAQYTINLYDSSRIIVATSGIKYVTTGTLPLTVTYTFDNLKNNNVYYLGAQGNTVTGTSVEIEPVLFRTQASTPSIFATFEVENNCDEGYILYTSSNFSLIEGISNPDPATYIDNQAVDLRASGSWARWEDNFTLPQNCTVKLWLREPTSNTTLFSAKNIWGESVEINYYENEDDGTVFAELVAAEAYTIYTDSIEKPDDDETLCIQLRGIDGLYDLKLEVVSST